MDSNVQFDKVKTLKASECLDGTWMLEGSYYKMKNVYSPNSFDLIAEFNKLEELQIFCDLNLPDVKLHIVSYQDWLSHCWHQLTKIKRFYITRNDGISRHDRLKIC